MRPRSMILFDRVFWVTMGLTVFNGVYSYQAIQERVLREQAVSGINLGSGFIGWTLGISLLFNLLIWFFISRKASDVARWIWVAVTGLGLLAAPTSLNTVFGESTLRGLILTALWLLQLILTYFLFTRESREWFARKGGPSPVDPAIFE